MKELTLSELHEVQFGLLKDFADFCDQHDLRYYLAYGTLLGAVRHGGFIPWDDDVDVWMPRPDYMRFCELYTSDSDEDSCLITPDNENSSWFVAKFMDRSTTFIEPGISMQDTYGVYIDIFPLDGISSASGSVGFRLRMMALLSHIYTYAHILDKEKHEHSIKGLIRRALGFFGRVKPKEWYRKKIDKHMLKDSFEESDLALSFATPYRYAKEIGSRSDYGEGHFLEFYNREFYVPTNYEIILERIYGSDWKTPIRHENGSHGVAYWRDEPQVEQTKTQ